MKTINISDMIGNEILVREADGQCHLSTLDTMHDEAGEAGCSNVLGWGEYDGDHRQWYRLDGAAWDFCFAASEDDCGVGAEISRSIQSYLRDKGHMSGRDICLDLGVDDIDVCLEEQTGRIVRVEPMHGGSGPWYAVPTR